jgi:3-oxoacyl-[acyl-carrier protein] reductase
MDLGLNGKVALVAGSSRGLGRAVAEAFAEEGMRLVLCARGEAALREAESALRARGAEVAAVPADLAEPGAAQRVVDAALAEFGRIDVLLTNAGGPPAGPFESHAPEAWQRAFALTLESVLDLTRAVLPGMKERRWGRILNVTSIAVKQPVDNLILSNSLRAAVTGFARTLANEVAPWGITVNNLLPGYTRTERLDDLADANARTRGTTPEEERARWEREIPMGRLGEPHEFAALAAFLASERAAYITGTSIPVDGGWVRALY